MNQIATALDVFRKVCTRRPCGLMTDIDGTISQVADHPDSANVDARAHAALRRIAGTIDLVAAITGRSAENARELVAIDELVYSGNHGMEVWRKGTLEKSPLAERYVPAIKRLLLTVSESLQIEGVHVENKGLTGSIHYRLTSTPEEAEAQILEFVDQLAARDGLKVTRGRMVVEIRPPVELDKGVAVIELIDEYELQSGVYIGDDTTDVDAFLALRRRREFDGSHFYAIGVASAETPETVVESADAMLDGVDGVVAFLSSAAKMLTGDERG